MTYKGTSKINLELSVKEHKKIKKPILEDKKHLEKYMEEKKLLNKVQHNFEQTTIVIRIHLSNKYDTYKSIENKISWHSI